MDVTVTPAVPEDAEEILAVQRLAFERQARLNNNPNIPPLLETIEQVREQFSHKLILKAVGEGRIIGSSRAYEEGGVVHIGRVSVHPGLQGQGIGTQMMLEIERRFPEAVAFRLFTGRKSEANIRLYGRLGYKIVSVEPREGGPELVHMEKRRPRGR